MLSGAARAGPGSSKLEGTTGRRGEPRSRTPEPAPEAEKDPKVARAGQKVRYFSVRQTDWRVSGVGTPRHARGGRGDPAPRGVGPVDRDGLFGHSGRAGPAGAQAPRPPVPRHALDARGLLPGLWRHAFFQPRGSLGADLPVGGPGQAGDRSAVGPDRRGFLALFAPDPGAPQLRAGAPRQRRDLAGD